MNGDTPLLLFLKNYTYYIHDKKPTLHAQVLEIVAQLVSTTNIKSIDSGGDTALHIFLRLGVIETREYVTIIKLLHSDNLLNIRVLT